MTNDKKDVLEHVPAARRDFLKKLLAGAAFAAPVIATFSIDALTAEPAYAQNITSNVVGFTANLTANQCATDVGYVGPQFFLAHVSGGLAPAPPPPPGGPKVDYRINGEVFFRLNMSHAGSPTTGPNIVAGYVNAIGGYIEMVEGVTLTSGEIMIGPATAVELTLAGITLSAITVFAPEKGAPVVCDLDELADAMAVGQATVRLHGIYRGSNFTVNGPIVASPTALLFPA